MLDPLDKDTFNARPDGEGTISGWYKWTIEFGGQSSLSLLSPAPHQLRVALSSLANSLSIPSFFRTIEREDRENR